MTPVVIAQFFDKPLALHRPAADALAAMAGNFAPVDNSWGERFYSMVMGVAIIPVQGILSPSAVWWSDSTGYDWIRIGVEAALDDPDVRAIVLDVNSPGGTVEGCFDLSDFIYASRGKKPIWAILGENAYSAAYAIASAADYITVPRTGGSGSIGIIQAHVDISKALKNMGVKYTYIQYGEKKSDGAAEKPLSSAALDCFQSDVDAMGDLFVATVARNRGISEATVKKTEAGTFMGASGVDIGLCDATLSPDAAFMALIAKLS